MRRRIPAWLAGPIWVACSVSAAAAQESASLTVEGFNQLPWGASIAEIEATYGPPGNTETLDNGVVVLAYDDTLLDRPSVTLYAILEGAGLVKGQQMVRLDLEAGDCEGQYRSYRDLVTLRFPLIRPIENYDYPFTMSFCEAVEAREGTWATQWKDASTGSVVTVIVEQGTDVVKLVFESRIFLEWLGTVSEQVEDPGP